MLLDQIVCANLLPKFKIFKLLLSYFRTRTNYFYFASSRSTQAAVSGSTTSHLKGNFLQKKVGTSTTSVKPELLNAHRALRELRSLHGNRALHESRKSSQLWTRQSQKSTSNSALMQQITNPRNLYHNDTVKHLMRQLSNVNHISYGKLVNRSGENEVFCSEVKLQSRTSEENRSSKLRDGLHNIIINIYVYRI